MNALLAADNWLILQFERFSHWFQRLTGKTNFFLTAALSLVISVVYFFLAFFTQLPIYFIGSAFFFIYSIFAQWSEKQGLDRVSRGFANPKKTLLPIKFIRIGIPVIYVPLIFSNLEFGVVNWMSNGILFLVWAILYLFACDPLPPGTSKLREWANSLKAAFAPQPVPSESRT
ncbi:MAG: hypothetical protein HYS44_02535 [Candidatus Niyogibacteria bacterium]|nr:hypothetical protein [Candidatus Niyogibacteria bacterium]